MFNNKKHCLINSSRTLTLPNINEFAPFVIISQSVPQTVSGKTKPMHLTVNVSCRQYSKRASKIFYPSCYSLKRLDLKS